jgi:hypothetical protein
MLWPQETGGLPSFESTESLCPGDSEQVPKEGCRKEPLMSIHSFHSALSMQQEIPQAIVKLRQCSRRSLTESLRLYWGPWT